MTRTRTLLLLTLLTTLAATAPAAAQTFETSAVLGEVSEGRVTQLASGPERVTDRPARAGAPRVQRQAAVAPKGPVAAASVAVLLLAFGLLVAPRRRGTS